MGTKASDRDQRLRHVCLTRSPSLVEHHSILACAAGDETVLRRLITTDKGWVNRPAPLQCPECGTPLGRPPLMAVTHSSLVRLAEFRDRLRACARLLLESGADPNQPWTDGEHQLTALYGAAGTNHDAELTRILLAAGANPNDGESLYHAVEAGERTCMELLLNAGAKVEGSNALHHQLDADDLEGLRLLLAHTKDPNDRSSNLGNPLLWAIRRRRSSAHIEMLLHAGADPHARNQEGASAYVLALRYGLGDVAIALRQAGAIESLSVEELFVSACASAERAEAQRILTAQPEIFQRLSESQLRQLPNLTEAGCTDAVRLMVELGWPIRIRGGDWDASALNLAVSRGDAELTRFLLEHGASWTEQHGHGDNVNGTLAWASRNHDPARVTGWLRASPDRARLAGTKRGGRLFG